MLLVTVLLTSSLRLLTSRTPLEPVCPARATLPAAAAAAAAALRGFRAPDGKQTDNHGVENHFLTAVETITLSVDTSMKIGT